jgi:hypothetical protein
MKRAKIGDSVRIVTPKRFVRCGYPLTYDIIRKTRSEECYELMRLAWAGILKIDKTLEQSQVLGPQDMRWAFTSEALPEMPRRVASLLEQAVCAYIVDRENWGGPQRKIYELDYPHVANAVVKIIGRRCVQTGSYVRGSTSYDHYSGECEWDPPYLADAKTHVVYEIDDTTLPPILCVNDEILMEDSGPLQKWEILAANCELLENGGAA